MGKEIELTVKQEQILSLAAQGMKDQLIAERLGISVRTVQNHLARIYTKTQTANRVGAVVLYVSKKVTVIKRQPKIKKRRASAGKETAKRA